MPVSINKSLPYMCLHFDNPEDDENRMRMLVDIESAMNMGDLKIASG